METKCLKIAYWCVELIANTSARRSCTRGFLFVRSGMGWQCVKSKPRQIRKGFPQDWNQPGTCSSRHHSFSCKPQWLHTENQGAGNVAYFRVTFFNYNQKRLVKKPSPRQGNFLRIPFWHYIVIKISRFVWRLWLAAVVGCVKRVHFEAFMTRCGRRDRAYLLHTCRILAGRRSHRSPNYFTFNWVFSVSPSHSGTLEKQFFRLVCLSALLKYLNDLKVDRFTVCKWFKDLAAGFSFLPVTEHNQCCKRTFFDQLFFQFPSLFKGYKFRTSFRSHQSKEISNVILISTIRKLNLSEVSPQWR